MLPYSYLVLGVQPTANETNVDLSAKITVIFAKHINVDSLNNNTVRLRKVNGNFVEYNGQYNHLAKTYSLSPNELFESDTEYQIEILGGADGILSIDGYFLPETKTYEFTTAEIAKMTDIPNLTLEQDFLFARASWELPDKLLPGEEIYFNVKISNSLNPDAVDLWPPNAMEGKTTATEFTIPYRLETGNHYYVHVQGVTNRGETEWITKQIYMEPIIESASQEENQLSSDPSLSETDGEQIHLLDHSPASREFMTPSEIVLAFDAILDTKDLPAVTGSWRIGMDVLIESELDSEISFQYVYVVQAPYKEKLSLIDLRGKYSFSNALAGTVTVDPNEPTLLIWTPSNPNVFEPEKEYTVIVSKDISGKGKLPLGVDYAFSFTSLPARFYGNKETIHTFIKNMNMKVPEPILDSVIKKYSLLAYDRWSTSPTFDDTLTDVPYFIHEYVNTQVAIDLLVNFGSSSATTGSEQIRLGDLQIDKASGNTTNVSVSSIMNLMKEQLKVWEDLIHGANNRGYAKPGAVVKGESVSPYPASMTRSTLKDLGT